MANNYTQFSEILTNLTCEECAWLKQELEEEFIEDAYESEEATEAAVFAYCNEKCVEDPDCWPEFSYVLEEEEEGVDRHLWIYSDECGNVEQIGVFMQRFLKKFRPNGHFALTWSGTCSRLREGEFGGGAFFVTADWIQYMNTWDWANALAIKFKDEHDTTKTRTS